MKTMQWSCCFLRYTTSLCIGCDISAAFTDPVFFSPDHGSLETFKLPSVPRYRALTLRAAETVLKAVGSE